MYMQNPTAVGISALKPALLEAKAASKKAVRGYKGGLVSLDLSLINQKGDTVHRGTWTLLVKGKPDDVAAPA